jgi:ribosomal protein S27AE
MNWIWSLWRRPRELPGRIAILEAEIARLRSHLLHTKDGELVIDCERLYCPRCGGEVFQSTDITHKDIQWKCAICLKCNHAFALNEVFSRPRHISNDRR